MGHFASRNIKIPLSATIAGYHSSERIRQFWRPAARSEQKRFHDQLPQPIIKIKKGHPNENFARK
jgi:hypothetical protein